MCACVPVCGCAQTDGPTCCCADCSSIATLVLSSASASSARPPIAPHTLAARPFKRVYVWCVRACVRVCAYGSVCARRCSRRREKATHVPQPAASPLALLPLALLPLALAASGAADSPSLLSALPCGCCVQKQLTSTRFSGARAPSPLPLPFPSPRCAPFSSSSPPQPLACIAGIAVNSLC